MYEGPTPRERREDIVLDVESRRVCRERELEAEL